MNYNFQEGETLLINKPYKWTSFDVVNRLRRMISKHLHSINPGGNNRIKVGHAGTLDPLATGLLIICTGKHTRTIDQLQAQEKEYTGSMLLGATTASFDLEQPIDKLFPTDHITLDLIKTKTSGFVGEIMQIPPAHSAVMVEGKRAYEIARKGLDPEIKPRAVYIKEFEVTQANLPEFNFKVTCSKGTYIRSLARDIGQSLNSGAHLTSLCRTRIGDFGLSEAMSIQEFEKEIFGDKARANI